MEEENYYCAHVDKNINVEEIRNCVRRHDGNGCGSPAVDNWKCPHYSVLTGSVFRESS